jgi:hypothetical protein
LEIAKQKQFNTKRIPPLSAVGFTHSGDEAQQLNKSNHRAGERKKKRKEKKRNPGLGPSSEYPTSSQTNGSRRHPSFLYTRSSS